MNLKQTILSIIKQNIPIQVVTGEVISIDETNMTCDVKIVSRPDRFDVRLRSIIDGQDKGILIYPKIGSKVLVGIIENNPQSSFICGFSEVDKIRLINCEIHLNGENHGGIVISQKIAQEINEIKQDLNVLKTIFSGWVIVAGDGGAALKAAAATWSANQLSLVNKVDLENDKVKHG